MMPALLSIGYAWLLGVMAVSLLWPRMRPWWHEAPVILPLGLGTGLGATSGLFFAATLISEEPGRLTAFIEGLAGIALAWGCWRRSRTTATTAAAPRERHTWLDVILLSLLAQVALVAIVVGLRAYEAEPFGSWDGWAIWNMHARFLIRGGELWPELLRQSPIAWTHPDYPLLVPASVARTWAHAGSEASALSGLVSAAFGLATVALLIAAVARLRNRVAACAGGLLLLGTPFFVAFSSNEHADIPLGFFVLASVAVLALSQRGKNDWRMPALAGALAGLAAWTKNEGLWFALAAGLLWGVYACLRRVPRLAAAFLAGLGLALIPVIYFKFALAAPNDLTAGSPISRLGNLLDGARHRLILTALWRDISGFGEWRLVPFFAMALPLIGSGWKRVNEREWLGGALLALVGAGYYGVYLLTPRDLEWHLTYSLVRLLLQLWPAALFCWCLAAKFPEPSDPARGLRHRHGQTLILLANVAVASAVLMAFACQLAPNQLSVAKVGGADIEAVVGPGWFPRESKGWNKWVWTSGEATVWLRVQNGPVARPIALRFDIRAFGERTVTVRSGDRILWQGIVGKPKQPVEITGLALPAGTTTITFTTETPGTPEGPHPGARSLAFALYNLRLQ